MLMYKKPLDPEEFADFLEMMGEPSEESIKRIRAVVNKDKQKERSSV